MGVTKGTNNFSQHQKQKVEENITKIKKELEQIPNKLIYSTPGAIVEYISTKISVHKTTITRNKKYMALIYKKFSEQPGINEYVPIKHINEQALASRLKVCQIENQLIISENKRLKNQLSQLLSEDIDSQACNQNTLITPPSSKVDIAFDHTAKSLHLVLERLLESELGIMLDEKNGTIVDLSKYLPSEQVIVTKSILKYYLEWKHKLKS